MMSYVPVEGNIGLARDKKTGAIVNINKDEMQKAVAVSERRKHKNEELKQLKNEIGELKALVKQLIEKEHGN